MCYGTNYFIIVDNDYNAGLYTVTIGAGEYGVTFSISITDDNIYEDSEIFNLTIYESSLPNGITSGVPNTTIVTILDNDCKWLTFLSLASYRFIGVLISCVACASVVLSVSSYNDSA